MRSSVAMIFIIIRIARFIREAVWLSRCKSRWGMFSFKRPRCPPRCFKTAYHAGLLNARSTKRGFHTSILRGKHLSDSVGLQVKSDAEFKYLIGS